MLTSRGEGGGIVTLLLPATEKDKRRLERDRAQYRLRRVRRRALGERGAVRDPDLIANFLEDVLRLDGIKLGPSWKATDFLKWLVSELQKPVSPVHHLAQRQMPQLLEKERSLRWWQARVTELKKMSR